jgi:AcrR family transcriptional regulator
LDAAPHVSADTKQRIVDVTAGLLMRQGLTATGLKQISKQSGAALGSLYHFFPGGKDDLAADALLVAGRGYLRLLDEYFTGTTDLVAATRTFFDGAAAVLEATDYADACPIATVALEVASTNERLRLVTAQVFQEWIDAGTARFVDHGLDEPTARELITFIVASLEGGFLLCRAAKSTEPMAMIGRRVASAVEASLSATA